MEDEEGRWRMRREDGGWGGKMEGGEGRQGRIQGGEEEESGEDEL